MDSEYSADFGSCPRRPKCTKKLHYTLDPIDVSGLYLDEKTADVHFVFIENDQIKKLPAHKTLLGVKSDVFLKMFTCKFKEGREVNIMDSSHDAFKEFLQFFYLDVVELQRKNAHFGIYLADRYNVRDAFKFYNHILEAVTDKSNVLLGYAAALFLRLDKVRQICEGIIAPNIREIFASEDFLHCNYIVVENILKLNYWPCTVLEVFEACLKWVEENSRREGVTNEFDKSFWDKLFYNIDFASITLDELFSCFLPRYRTLFKEDDIWEIIRIIGKSYKSEKFKADRHHKTECSIWNGENLVTTSRILRSEFLSFTPTRPIFLQGFACVGILEPHLSPRRKGNAHFLTKIKITVCHFDIVDVKVLFEGFVNLKFHEITRIELPVPIIMQPDHEYRIIFKHSPNGCRIKDVPMHSQLYLDPPNYVNYISLHEFDNSMSRSLISSLTFYQIAANE